MHLPSSLVLFMGLALVIGFMMYMFREFIALALKAKPRDFTVNVLNNKKTARAAVLVPRSPHACVPNHQSSFVGTLPPFSGCHLFTAHGAGTEPAPSPALYLRKRDKT
jgi:hypothetical protein